MANMKKGLQYKVCQVPESQLKSLQLGAIENLSLFILSIVSGKSSINQN